MSNVKDFLKRKDIVITPQRYLIEALGAMAQGLFASLLIGTIIKTLGQQTGLETLVDLGGYATAMSGPAMVPILNYNSEADLGALVNLIYLSARDNYRMEREDRAGKGFADFIFYPYDPCDTALILELKVDAAPETALEQIQEKKYALRFKDLIGDNKTSGKVFAVALTYDRSTKKHSCAVRELDICNLQ